MSQKESRNDIKLDCEIVCDLLPIYHDDVVSDVTKEAVEKHLDQCESCRKEYESLCCELPEESGMGSSTKGKFTAMMKRSRKKRIAMIGVAVVLTCAVLCGLFYLLCKEPLSHTAEDDMEILCAYKYQSNEGEKWFVLYTVPFYTCARTTYVTSQEDHIEELHSVIPFIHDALDYDKRCMELYNGSADEECTALVLGDKVIWSEEENGDDVIPDYIYEVEKTDILLMDYDSPDAPTIGVQYEDGLVYYWNLDGAVHAIYKGKEVYYRESDSNVDSSGEENTYEPIEN